ncbi:MAG: LytTR family DNA-binding domain-containing protein [Fulvivirga sp.]
MRVLIIEDEKMAANRLEKLVKSVDDKIEILAKVDTVTGSVAWLSANVPPDLIFMDIQLADGLSFEIFDHTTVEAPVIFTTAYDEYALKAFKVNSIDYLLKPIDADELKEALNKLNKVRPHNIVNPADQIAKAMEMLTNKYKQRFLVKTGEHIKSIPTDEIAYFFSRDKASYCHTFKSKNFLIDYPLEEIDAKVNPEQYFRVNRKHIISMASIKDIISYSNSRLKVVLFDEHNEEVIVSRERVATFKAWLDR